MKPSKVETVMKEFKQGKLKSSSGQKVTNPKQAIAIGLSEAGMSKPKRMKEGDEMKKDSKAMAKKEIAFMQKKGAPKSMIKHEKAEYGIKSGGKAYAGGGFTTGSSPISSGVRTASNAPIDFSKVKPTPLPKPTRLAAKSVAPARTAGRTAMMKSGGKAYAKGGGVEVKGKTKGKIIKMAGGGRGC